MAPTLAILKRDNDVDLKTRVTNMLTTPATEWPVIAGETTTPTALITGYAALLAAIPAVCGFIGMTIVGMSIPLVGTVRTGIVSGVATAIVSFVLGLVGVYIAAIIVEKLAPTFQSRGDTTQAMKLVVYASTPIWVAGVLQLVPALGVLTALAGLYGIYLFYLGLPPVMHTPADKVVPYMVVAAIVMIVLSICFGFVTAAITGVRGYRGF
jgi:Yip1-like protein